jgi:hypothetical protein
LILAVFTIAVKDVSAATSPTLGAVGSYSILAGSIVTNTGPTTMPGDLGISPSIGVPPHYTNFPPGIVGPPGTIHDADAHAAAAQAADTAAFGFLDQSCDVTYAGVKDLVGLSLVAGVYCADAFTLSGILTLSGSGVWIFKSASTLITSGTANVVGGDPCNVWWRVVSSATLGTNTALIGNILALTSISLQTGASLNGRALAQTGAVTLDSNTVNGPICATPPSSTTTTSSTVRTTVIDTVQSTTTLGTSPYLTLVSTIGTSTSTSHSTSEITVGDTVYRYVTEFDTVYAYVLVILEQLQKAVGGFIESVDKFAVFTPYLALFGVIAAVVAVFAIRRKRQA